MLKGKATDSQRRWNGQLGVGEKRCGLCGETKARFCFRRDRRTEDGMAAYCKECVRSRETHRVEKYVATLLSSLTPRDY